MGRVDEDLETMDRQALLEEVRRLRTGIRTHRDGSGHDLCWHHPELWDLLPERTGVFEVRLVEAKRVIGRIAVRPQEPRESGRRAGKRRD